jgi:hypothetical protein
MPTMSFSAFRSIFYAASKEYKKKTGKDLLTHPLAAELDNCDSPDTVLALLQKQADALEDSGKSHQTLMKWLNSTVHVLYMISVTLGEGIDLVSIDKQVFLMSLSMNSLFAAVISSKGHIYLDQRPSRGNFPL